MSTAAPPTTDRVLRRPLTPRAATADTQNRTISAIIATERAVTVFDVRSGDVIDEILLLDGVELPRGTLPMLENHQRGDLRHHLGSVRNLRVEDNVRFADGSTGRALTATLHFSDTEEAERAWQLVSAGHATDISSGNRAIEAVRIEPGESRRVNGRTFTAGDRPLQVTTRWQPREASVVSIGADELATTRNHPMTTDATRRTAAESEKRTMVTGLSLRMNINVAPGDAPAPTARELERSGWYADLFTVARACLQLERVEVPADRVQILERALATAAFGDVLTDVGERILITALAEEADTVSPWTRALDVPNFRKHSLASLIGGKRLERRERGGTAESLDYDADIESEAIEIVRYAGVFSADRQDLAGDDIGVIREALADVVRAAIRTRHDLAFSVLLANPEMRDGNDLFSADHGNDITGALDADNLGEALQRIRTQRINGQTAALVPRVLLVPPHLEGAGREAIRAISMEGEQPLQLVVEDRLAAGITDPRDGETEYSGSEDTWYVSTTGQRGVVFGWLEGANQRPVLQSFPFQGEDGFWGQRWAIHADMDAAAADWRGIVRGAPGE